MPLRFIESKEDWRPGLRVNNRLLPSGVERLWTVDELAEVGLERFVPEPVVPEYVPRRVGEFREFLLLFTNVETEAIQRAVLDPDNWQIKTWYDRAMTGSIDLEEADTSEGFEVMVAAGLLSRQRADQILLSDFNEVDQ